MVDLSGMPVDRCSHMILMAMTLQLLSFLGASFDEHVVIDIVYSICGTVENTSPL